MDGGTVFGLCFIVGSISLIVGVGIGDSVRGAYYRNEAIARGFATYVSTKGGPVWQWIKKNENQDNENEEG